MLVVVICLLVLAVAGVVLRDGLRDGTTKRATTGPRRGRARRGPTPRPARPSPPPSRPTRPQAPPAAIGGDGRHPLRSGVALVASSAGIGLLVAATLGVGILVVLVLLRAAVDA